MAPGKTFTMEEVAKHNTATDMWIVIDGSVYDLTKFTKFHPGGVAALMPVAGKDATEAFFELHKIEVLRKYQRFVIGKVAGYKGFKDGKTLLELNDPTELSMVPYSETAAFHGFPSPFYNESHLRFRKAVAAFREEHLRPVSEQHENAGKAPSDELLMKVGKAGMLLCRLGPGPWMKDAEKYGITIPGGVKPEEFDYFHEMICHNELNAKLGAPGFAAGLGDGFCIGFPPILHFASPALREKVSPSILRGEKRICLAISEPQAGSDVANLVTTAKKSPCGRYYIVNGTKKWITNGHQSHYFATAVRTGKGMGGITMLLIERSEGLKTTPISTAYSPAAGTALVEFFDVKVPVENILGKENQGFRCVMYNFNHERWMIIANVVASMRYVQDETFKWAQQRKVFGKKLTEQPVIRAKLARIVASTESMMTWLEQVTFQMNQMRNDHTLMMEKLAGPLALLKYQCTRAALQVADDCAQILGGRAITKTGMGRTIEQYIRTIKFGAILGGSEEIMADLGIRQAIKNYPSYAKL